MVTFERPGFFNHQLCTKANHHTSPESLQHQWAQTTKFRFIHMLRQYVNPRSTHQNALVFTTVSATAGLGFTAVFSVLAPSTAQHRLIPVYKAGHRHRMPYGLVEVRKAERPYLNPDTPLCISAQHFKKISSFGGQKEFAFANGQLGWQLLSILCPQDLP